MTERPISAHVERDERRVWMVEGVPIERGCETPTYGPFPTLEAAQAFANGSSERYVYDASRRP